MAFTGHGHEFNEFVNEHVVPLAEEMMTIGSELDTSIEEGHMPDQDTIEWMAKVADKTDAQGKYFKFVAENIRNDLKNILDEGTGALNHHEEEDSYEEEEDVAGDELVDLAKHAREVVSTLELEGIDEEIIQNIVEFAEYIEMLA